MIRQAFRTLSIGRYTYGGLKDADRIFTNVYKDADPYINGALKRVIVKLFREIGIGLKTSLVMAKIG